MGYDATVKGVSVVVCVLDRMVDTRGSSSWGGARGSRNPPPSSPPPPHGAVPTWAEILQRDEAHRKAQNDMMGHMVQVMETMQANPHGA